MTATTEPTFAGPEPPERARPAMSHRQVLEALPAPVAGVIEHAYGTVGEIFLAAVALLREVPLGGKSGIDIARERASTHHQQGATS